ncbi:MAG: (d)CMP kinase [Lachnospiraceae bacterium]|nr:(d)CMP kinase [Clostridium sp.]MDY4820338.1 (d)CMP kinase [Lachnospiraceae bacterium]MEE0398796.1 (d)CMP kinase [Lachnospiraceae bacterium]CDA69776.1 cytidylate kinase [Clostridium sp. CAG:510]
MSYCVAIDGPAGAGKSTIAKKIAKKMQLIYVDTGAMYRAMALFLLRNHVSPEDAAAIERTCEDAEIGICYEKGQQVVYLNGENVNDLLRSEEVGKMASISSQIKSVRRKLVDLQRRLAETTDVIMDGRDIGTCVLPDADVKIYLTASSRVRAQRRFDELQEKGIACNFDEIEKDIIERDRRDMTREESPLKKAEDAIEVDTSDMSIEQVIATIIRICEEKKEK